MNPVFQRDPVTGDDSVIDEGVVAEIAVAADPGAGQTHIAGDAVFDCAGPETETILARLLDAGLVPVISHPERNRMLRNDIGRLTAWVDLGCRMQLTAMSITGGFGRAARSSALQILHCGLAHFVASDAHDAVHRGPSMTDAFRKVANLLGDEDAQRLFVMNPMHAVRGIPIPITPTHAPETTRKWWCFWRSRFSY